MANTYSSWNSINEATLARGKQVIKDPISGKRQKIAYKVQSDNKLIIRLIKMLSIVDAAGNITNQGASILLDFMNSQLAILSNLPEARSGINDAWFKKYLFIYTVKKDTQRREDEGPAEGGREKIQFTIVKREDFPSIPEGTKFINTLVLDRQGGSIETTPIIDEIIQDNQESVNSDDTDDGANMIERDQTEDDATGTDETADLAGKRFRYTMRTNSKLYLMEFTEDGAIDARLVKESDPNGVISWEDPKIMWITDADKTQSGWKSNWSNEVPLYQDQEITNRIDKDFLYKMFNDAEFRDRILSEYEEEFGGSELSAENLRNQLYYKNGNPIFAEATASTSGSDAGTDYTPVSTVTRYQDKTIS
jgi:hypothetical protein